MTDDETVVRNFIAAWSRLDVNELVGYFTEDATYFDKPNTEKPWNGHEEIVKAWSEAGDKPEDWKFEWTLLGQDGDTAFVQGVTTYLNGEPTYDNLWVIRFADDGRAREFTEWYMARK